LSKGKQKIQQHCPPTVRPVGNKDIIFKALVRDFASVLFGLRLTDVELLETSHQRVEDRHSDLLAKMCLHVRWTWCRSRKTKGRMT